MPKLKEYIDKRNFSQTKEPVGGDVTGKKLAFVVQRHHASRLHYDFRLQMKGVLKSWAVPKGPSLNPQDKRLAMMVEDHPLDYKDFEGEIPKGNYGAGNVHIWDEGYYIPIADYKDPEKGLLAELKSGNLKIILMGKRLKGEFAIVKIKSDEENAWLLIKHKDKYAVNKDYDSEDFVAAKIKNKKNITSEQTATKKKSVRTHTTIKPITPMMATLGSDMVKGDDWIFEPKLDGYRIVAITDGYHNSKLFTRNQLDYTSKYENVAEILKKLDRACVLDGEVVKLNDDGKPSFNALQLFGKNPVGKVHYYVFDLLQLDEHSLLEMPLTDRKKILEALVKSIDSPYIIFTPYESGNGNKLLEEARKNNSEGIMAKKADSIYHPGYRTKEWIKLKVNQEDEFIIGGYTEPRGKKGLIGAFLLGENKNGNLTFSGKCGTGLDELRDQEIYATLKDYEITKSPFTTKITNDTKIHWLKPELVCTVKYSERTEDGKLRHPVFKALREDKTVTDMKPAEDNYEIKANGNKVTITNRNKVYFPDNGITKGDVVDYYDTIADYILPYLKDRPLSLHRHPNGINAPSFFQKDIETKSYNWLKTVSIHSESNDKDIDYLVCNDKKTLLYMANLGCIEINPWLSRYPGIEKPDFLVLDLDPEQIGFESVIEVALTIKELLDSLSIPSYPKTSGSTGIHIYIYTGAKYHYDSVKLFAEWLAGKAHELIPSISSIERSPQKRQKKVYIDFLQNRKGQTIAAAYSLRPKPGATVSWPLSWDEVTKELKMEDYTIKNVPSLLTKRKNPWADIYSSTVNIAAIMKKLQV
ncbi:DNA ligase D [Solitalea canadensis]|uniref:DNA ligase (ATP) n=1 Tax=Solitalea canadensis (strain ATCC 29591 / DSM 3403 / JCM 21819 / LMG 8368 / NBRC 15130 / NCIMB 12057 / USAM 9D) TaxID=929556 RepID=H8KQK1_SOLCM|nr:DNA ligase D [Solitalea canadensis]AFD06739.1 DNA ligase D [Solitalea canadensis DSM 3403]